MLLKFDEANLAKVARVVRKFNKYATRRPIEQIICEMKGAANVELFPRPGKPGSTFISTGGWMLTAFRPRFDPDNLHVKASVADCCFSEDDITNLT